MKDYAEMLGYALKSMRETYIEVAGSHPIEIFDKATYDEVTSLDLAIEKRIIERVRSVYGDAQFLSEEYNAKTALTSGEVWIIDPIDGTCNLSHGLHTFGVQCAFVENGDIKFSAIYLPFSNEEFTAIKGNGAYLNGKRIERTVRPVNRCLISFGDFVHSDEKIFEQECEIMRRVASRVERVRMYGAASLDFAYAACGRLDGNFTFVKNAWDIVPGILLCREAGLILCDALGNDYTFGSDTVAAFASEELKNACVRD